MHVQSRRASRVTARGALHFKGYVMHVGRSVEHHAEFGENENILNDIYYILPGITAAYFAFIALHTWNGIIAWHRCPYGIIACYHGRLFYISTLHRWHYCLASLLHIWHYCLSYMALYCLASLPFIYGIIAWYHCRSFGIIALPIYYIDTYMALLPGITAAYLALLPFI